MGGFLGAMSMLETCVDRFNYDSTILYSYDDVIQAMLAGNMMAYKMIREQTLEDLDLEEINDNEEIRIEFKE